ncbi:hypothetical protein D3C71_1311240 [compost metagenome]
MTTKVSKVCVESRSSAWASGGNSARQTQTDRHAGTPGMREAKYIRFSNTTPSRPASGQRATKRKVGVFQENRGGPRARCAGQRRLIGKRIVRGDAGASRYNSGASTSRIASHGNSREAMVQ